jgi:CheY-like chemotaxis protein
MKKNKTILIIDDDDDDDDRELFSDAINEVDSAIQYVAVKNGEEALTLLKDKNTALPDYIFLDLNMPRMNGKQCLAEIKKDERLRFIPVIIYSTTRRPKDEEEMKQLGAAYFLTKPALFNDICKAIVFVLGQKW